MDIQILPATEIDQLKWDSCVHYATHPSFTGYTWYLNAWDKDWIGMVEGDYESVMPLFRQKDWLGRTIYRQPGHIGPTGPFSIHVMSRPRILAFLKAAPGRLQHVLLPWEGQVGLPGVSASPLKRDLLQLYEPYAQLKSGFSWLKDAGQKDWAMIQLTPESIASFWQKHEPSYRGKDKDVHRYHRIMYQALHRGHGFLSGIGSTADQLEAAAFFITTGGILYRLFSASVPGQRGEEARRAMYDLLIQTHAGRPWMLDFNGDALARSFGATRMHYTRIDSGPGKGKG